MARSVLAVVAGVVAGGLSVMLVEAMSSALYPLPPGVSPDNPESIRAYMRQIPVAALLFVALAWAVGSFIGGWVAARLAPQASRHHALIVGAVLMVGAVITMVMMPHPQWFWASLLIFLPAAELGARFAHPRLATTGTFPA